VAVPVLALALGALAPSLLPVPAPAQQAPIRTQPLPGGTLLGGCTASGDDKRMRVSCEEARRAEQEFHRMEMLELQQARTNANAEYQIARRNCRGDAECNRRAHDDQMARLQEIANRQSVETARHKNAMSQIAAVERQMRDQVKPTR
jgi:hypothetical protein